MLSNLKFGKTRKNGVSYGCYFKATAVEDGIKYYYKCSNYYSGNNQFGDESLYEVICSRLAYLVGIPCISCELVSGDVTIEGIPLYTHVCKSPDFSIGYDSRMTFGEFVRYNGGKTNDVIDNFNFRDAINRMFVFDFLVIQRDRHENNIEVLSKDGLFSIAPLFDNGLSFFAPYPSCYTSSIKQVVGFDVMQNCDANNYIGERSLQDNLDLITKPVKLLPLLDDYEHILFRDMIDKLPPLYINKIWDIIKTRYAYLQDKGYIL